MCYFHGHVVFCTHRFISYAYAHTDKPDELDRVNNACIIIIISGRERERKVFVKKVSHRLTFINVVFLKQLYEWILSMFYHRKCTIK